MLRRTVLCAVTGCFLGLLGCESEKGLRITNIEPKAGPPGGGSSVTIYGSGFQNDGAKGATVYFGGRKGRVLKFMGDDKMRVETPMGEKDSTVDVIIEFEDARKLVYQGGYSYKEVGAALTTDSLVGGDKSAPKPAE